MSTVSPKVAVASVTSVAVTLVSTYILKGTDPSVIELLVSPLVAGALTFAAGWLKRDKA